MLGISQEKEVEMVGCIDGKDPEVIVRGEIKRRRTWPLSRWIWSCGK